MAGERKGKTYEALVMVALRELRRQGKVQGEIFWNQTPEGMTIEPDFTIGKDANQPKIILLVTHSGAAGNSHMKFWRNMGELAEAKTLLPAVPRVYSVAFDSVIKEDLKKLQYAAFDGQLIVGDRDYGKAIQKWVDANHKELPVQGLAKAGEIEERLSEDSELVRLMRVFIKDLELLLKQEQPELDELWQMERERLSRPRTVPVAKNTFVRRGLSKLLIYEDLDRAVSLYRGMPLKIAEVPRYAYDLGLAKKTIGKAVPDDTEIENAVSLLDDKQLESIVSSAPLAEMGSWLLTLRNPSHLEFMGRYVVAEYDHLCDSGELATRLMDLHDNPWALVEGWDVPENWPPESVWLLEYLIELIKASTGSANGYGYAQLARDVITLGFGSTADLSDAGQFGGGFGFSAWIARKEYSSFRNDLILGIATVVARRLSMMTREKAARLVMELPKNIANNIIEAKLCTYKTFEPLFILITKSLNVYEVISIPSAFAERAGLRGRAGKPRVIKAGQTLIKWQSVSDAGRDHKKKELCGRAVALRYTWDADAKQFRPRPGVKKLILVVDGTWRQDDLDALVRAGWDEIFYPDEMDKLVKAIV
ncbi:MAG: hypothetical protein ACOY81_07460 [Bacillota bacterium]